jgi:hypothetical protein
VRVNFSILTIETLKTNLFKPEMRLSLLKTIYKIANILEHSNLHKESIINKKTSFAPILRQIYFHPVVLIWCMRSCLCVSKCQLYFFFSKDEFDKEKKRFFYFSPLFKIGAKIFGIFCRTVPSNFPPRKVSK